MSATELLLSARKITYRAGTKLILDGASVELKSGEVVAILGPNGSGKTTLLKLMAGLLPLGSGMGQVLWKGQDFLEMNPAQRARNVAYVGPELFTEFPLKAFDAVLMGRICHGQGLFSLRRAEDLQKAEWAMSECFCAEWRDLDLNSLSGGEKQLVALARALAQGAPAVLLDESLSKMDLHHQAAIGKLLKRMAERGQAVALVSHDVNLATEWADRCVLMNRGRIVADGKPSEALTPANLGELYPGTRLISGKNPETGAPKIHFGKD